MTYKEKVYLMVRTHAMKLVLFNLILRLATLAVVLIFGRWFFGDAHSYLSYAKEVCSGAWGGEPGRPPLYLWFLCGLSPNISIASTGYQLFLPLLIQTTIVWLSGFWMVRKAKNPTLALFWLYDPVHFLYSVSVMTDALFSVALLVYCLAFYKILVRPGSRSAYALGLIAAAIILLRPHGFIVFISSICLWIAALFYEFLCKKSCSLRYPLQVLLVVLILLTPRILWNARQGYGYVVSLQGESWLASVAAVVKYNGTGISAEEAERRWFAETVDANVPRGPWKDLSQHIPSLAALTAKGVLRVLFGHVNLETAYLVTGETPIGPAWFKPQESRGGVQVSTAVGISLWAFGLLTTGFFALAFYWYTIGNILIARLFKSPFGLWCVGSAVLMSLLPLVYGEARFHLSVWPFLIALLLAPKQLYSKL